MRLSTKSLNFKANVDLDEDLDENGSYFGVEDESVKDFDGKSSEAL